jgi:hypothetical protein
MCEIGHIYLKGMIPNTELTQPATLVIKATQVTQLWTFKLQLLIVASGKNFTNLQNSTNLRTFFSLGDRTKTVLDTSLSFYLYRARYPYYICCIYAEKDKTIFVSFFNCLLNVFLPPCIIQ